jgi:hypothetical protein
MHLWCAVLWRCRWMRIETLSWSRRITASIIEKQEEWRADRIQKLCSRFLKPALNSGSLMPLWPAVMKQLEPLLLGVPRASPICGACPSLLRSGDKPATRLPVRLQACRFFSRKFTLFPLPLWLTYLPATSHGHAAVNLGKFFLPKNDQNVSSKCTKLASTIMHSADHSCKIHWNNFKWMETRRKIVSLHLRRCPYKNRLYWRCFHARIWGRKQRKDALLQPTFLM